ncbi:MAG: nitrogen fixation protein [Azovibrio sp.]|nr:nitrogen fixation protein [Azovibrio sp.]
MRLIAVTSQNGRTVTAHAGRCRRFFLFGDSGGPMVGTVELLPEEVLHAAPLGPGHPLAPIRVLISAGMGQDLYQRLSACGIQVYLTRESSPEMAVRLYLAGVPSLPCNANSGCGQHQSPHAS